MPNNSLKLLATGLADQGIASLRIDKRGIGKSRSAAFREDDLRFGTYVEDAVRWIDFLRAQDRVSRVAVLGHSEGVLVATLAAQRADVTTLVLVAGAGVHLRNYSNGSWKGRGCRTGFAQPRGQSRPAFSAASGSRPFRRSLRHCIGQACSPI
nr:alpha/beta fold hydrolase [Rhodomicrobium udaipurense]